MIKPNQIICGDCLDIMRDMPNDSVDLVLTDPPYTDDFRKLDYSTGRTHNKGLAERKHFYIDPALNKPLSKEQFIEIQRLSTNQIIFGGNHFADFLPVSTCWIVWDKDNGGGNFSDCELAWGSFDLAIRKVRYRWAGMLQEPGQPRETKSHPTQKPLGVMMWILERYSKPNDLIFDPFCGSGTTCVAAKRLGRRWIGIDISEEYCQIARDRLAAEEAGLTVKEMKKGQRSMFQEE